MKFIILTLDDGRCLAIRADHIIHICERAVGQGCYVGVTLTDIKQSEDFAVIESYSYIIDTIRKYRNAEKEQISI